MKLLLFSMVLLLYVGTAWSKPITVVSIEPAFSTADPGNIFALDITITSITDLVAFQFDVAYTAAALSALTIEEGSFLAGGGEIFFIPGTIDNTLGLISASAAALIGPVPGVSGTGTLARVQFKSMAKDAAVVDIPNVLLLDSAGTSIDAITRGARVNIPEPSSGRLMALALAAGVVVVRSRSRKHKTPKELTR
jgi:hypothetical protein